jgi:hypothetical protein
MKNEKFGYRDGKGIFSHKRTQKKSLDAQGKESGRRGNPTFY